MEHGSMSSIAELQEIEKLVTRAVEGDEEALEEISVETLALMMCSERIAELEAQTKEEFENLKERQSQVRFLHKLLKAINATTSSKDEIDWSQDEELKSMLDQAREMGIDIPEGYTFNKENKTRLVENIKMTVDDLNIENEMQLQTISRLTNERYEAYQMARSIIKPLHEDKINKARKIAG
jgi:hypothetical protein